MDPNAIAMMIVAMVLIWGGLVAAILHLRARPEVTELDDPDAALPVGGDADRGPSRDT